VWSVDLQKRYGEFQIQFGMTSTPVLDNGRLYLQLIHGSMRDRSTTSRGVVAALNAATGDEIWKHERQTDATFENKHSYASPLVVHDGERSFLVTHGGDFVMGHSLEDGTELWRCGGLNPRENYNPTLRFVASPVFSDGVLVVPSAKNGPVLALRTDQLDGDVTDNEAAYLWKIDKGTPDVASPVIANDLVFLARENGAVMCLDAKSGEQLWMERLLADRHRSTPVVVGDHLYICDREGTILVLEVGREGSVLSRNELGEETLASPAVSDGKLYVRTFDALYCFGN
jgi:outer membrane protein assembly factor BamB